MTIPQDQATDGIPWDQPPPPGVWVMWHVPTRVDERGGHMLIGVYSSQDAALAAVARLAVQPGFCDNPEVVDDVAKAGFYLELYALDQDHWTEGYGTDAG